MLRSPGIGPVSYFELLGAASGMLPPRSMHCPESRQGAGARPGRASGERIEAVDRAPSPRALARPYLFHSAPAYPRRCSPRSHRRRLRLPGAVIFPRCVGKGGRARGRAQCFCQGLPPRARIGFCAGVTRLCAHLGPERRRRSMQQPTGALAGRERGGWDGRRDRQRHRQYIPTPCTPPWR